MTRLSAAMLVAVLSLLLLVITGCVPGEDDHVDETRDPNYQRGCALVKSLDFQPAVEEFEKALEVNPRSAAAHFELAWLCEEKQKDYAAAIYHYQKHLGLRPHSEYTDRAKDHIAVCRRELAKAEFSPPNTLALQRQIDLLRAENLLLKQQAEGYRTQLVSALLTIQNTRPPTPEPAPQVTVQNPPTVTPSEVTRSVPTGPGATQTGSSTPLARTGLPPSNPGTSLLEQTANHPSVLENAGTPATKPKVHVVKSGETLASIAITYKVRLTALQTANPSINPKRLKVGQNVAIP